MNSKPVTSQLFLLITVPVAIFSYLASTGIIFGLTDFGDYQIYTNFFYDSAYYSQQKLYSTPHHFGLIFTSISSFFYRHIARDHKLFFFAFSFFSLYIKVSFIFIRLKNKSNSFISSLIYISMIAVFFENIRIRASLSISLAIVFFLLSLYLNRFIQSFSFRSRNSISAVFTSIIFFSSALAVYDVNLTGLFFLLVLFVDQYIFIPLSSNNLLSRLNPKQLTLTVFVFSLFVFIFSFLSNKLLPYMSFLNDTPLAPYAFELGNDYVPKFLIFFVIFIFFIRSISFVHLFSSFKSSFLPFSYILIPAALGFSLTVNQYLFYATLESVFYYMLIDVFIWSSSTCRNLLFLFSFLYFNVRVLPSLISTL